MRTMKKQGRHYELSSQGVSNMQKECIGKGLEKTPTVKNAKCRTKGSMLKMKSTSFGIANVRRT